MICLYCKKTIEDDSKFCRHCGTKVIQANVCPKCGAEPLPKDAKFCPDCGASLAQKDENAIRQEAARIVEKYPKGYKRFVIRQELPHFSARVGLANCEKIISMETDIANMEKAITIEKQKQKNLDDLKGVQNSTFEYASPTKFVHSDIIPYWPKQGEELSQPKSDALKSAKEKISRIRKNKLSALDLSKYKFIEQCLVAILDVSKGYAPYYRGIVQNSPDYWHFWQNVKKECGEGNYNKYWHYNSGRFADMVLEKLRTL